MISSNGQHNFSKYFIDLIKLIEPLKRVKHLQEFSKRSVIYLNYSDNFVRIYKLLLFFSPKFQCTRKNNVSTFFINETTENRRECRYF